MCMYQDLLDGLGLGGSGIDIGHGRMLTGYALSDVSSDDIQPLGLLLYGVRNQHASLESRPKIDVAYGKPESMLSCGENWGKAHSFYPGLHVRRSSNAALDSNFLPGAQRRIKLLVSKVLVTL